MVSRRLFQFALMALVVFVPCVSHATTPVVVTASSFVTFRRTRAMIRNFMTNNALNTVDSFEYGTSFSADYINSQLKVSYPGVVAAKGDTTAVVSHLCDLSSDNLYGLMYALSANVVVNVTLNFAVETEAINFTSEVNAGNIEGFVSATLLGNTPSAFNSGNLRVVDNIVLKENAPVVAFVGGMLGAIAVVPIVAIAAIIFWKCSMTNAQVVSNPNDKGAATIDSFDEIAIADV